MRYAYAPNEPLAQELRTIIQIQRRSTSVDDYGQQLDVWNVTSTPRASFKPDIRQDAGSEFNESQTPLARNRMFVTLRGGIEVDAADRIYVVNSDGTMVKNGDILDIKEVMDMRGRWIYLRVNRLGDVA